MSDFPRPDEEQSALEWIGVWRWLGCFNKWEDGLRIQTALQKRTDKKEFRAIKESIKNRGGFAMSTVDVVSEWRGFEKKNYYKLCAPVFRFFASTYDLEVSSKTCLRSPWMNPSYSSYHL